MSSSLMKGIVISLCDVTGHFVQPWIDFGYTALLVDPLHEDFGEGNILKFPGTIAESLPFISLLLLSNKIVFVAGFPPCTDVAVSGACRWEDKRFLDPYFQCKAAIVAEQCRTIGELSNAPWFFENPVSAFSNIFGPPSYTFSPDEYVGYCETDNYTKKTCLWAGNRFIMPKAYPRGSLGQPNAKLFANLPENDSRQFLRSQTPIGFSRAVFLANAPEFRGGHK